MRAVVQRVKSSLVKVEEEIVGNIQSGLLVLLGVSKDDLEKDADYLVNKILGLRIFNDNEGNMNVNISDTKGEILVVSQFTLYGDARKGNRPSYVQAAKSEQAQSLYRYFVKKLKDSGLTIETGAFGADMDVSLVNDGPVTILLDSERNF